VVKKSSSSFAVLLVSDFSLQALLRTQSENDNAPIAILDGDRRRAVIIARNDAARESGVVPGLTASQALSRCPELKLNQPHAAAENEASAALLAAAALLSPLVEDTASGIATADVTALPPAQREPRLARAIEQLAQLGLTATAGIAPTPLLALYAARAALKSQPLNPNHSAGDVGHKARPTDTAPPTSCRSGFTPDREPRPAILSVSNAHAFLAPLPLEAAEPEPGQIDILRLWGINTLGELTALPKADVAQRLGPSGLALWERAAGEATRPIRSLPPPRHFAAEMEFEHLIESLEPLLFLIRRFLDRLCLELQGVGLAATEINLSLQLDDDTTHQRTIRLPEPTADPELLFRTLQSHLETVQTDAPVSALRIELAPSRPRHRQHGLFDTSLRDPHGFAETLARVAALLGSDHVGTPQLADTHQPDILKLIPPADPLPEAPTENLPPALTKTGLTLRRFRPPVTARVELSPGQRAPTYVWTDQRRITGTIVQVLGPWRANGDWWQADQAWAQEEWDIALAPPTRGLYRLIHTPAGWYLEGEYD